MLLQYNMQQLWEYKRFHGDKLWTVLIGYTNYWLKVIRGFSDMNEIWNNVK